MAATASVIHKSLTKTAGPGMGTLGTITSHVMVGPRSKIPEGVNPVILTIGGETPMRLKSRQYFLPCSEFVDVNTIFDRGYNIINDTILTGQIILIDDNGSQQGVILLAMYYLVRMYELFFLKNRDQMERILSPEYFFTLSILQFIQRGRKATLPRERQIDYVLARERSLKAIYVDTFSHMYAKAARAKSMQNPEADELTQTEYFNSLFPKPVEHEQVKLLPTDDFAELGNVVSDAVQ